MHWTDIEICCPDYRSNISETKRHWVCNPVHSDPLRKTNNDAIIQILLVLILNSR